MDQCTRAEYMDRIRIRLAMLFGAVLPNVRLHEFKLSGGERFADITAIKFRGVHLSLPFEADQDDWQPGQENAQADWLAWNLYQRGLQVNADWAQTLERTPSWVLR